MADTAFKAQYRDEWVAGFEQSGSKFMNTGVTERVISGNTAYFLVADTGGREAVTRSTSSGLIPSAQDSLTQPSATLQEWHDKPRRTKFNIFASQGDGRRILQAGSIKVVNRKIDDLIITALSAATNDTGTAATASLALFAKASAILGNEDVDIEDEENMFCAISPAAAAYLAQVPEYNSADYVEVKGMNGSIFKAKRWLGCNFFVSNRLSGRTTSAEKLLMYHRNSFGWAIDSEGLDVTAGYNEEDAYYWARASAHCGAALIQNDGVCVIAHDGSAYVAS
jgi:hypothetical protein